MSNNLAVIQDLLDKSKPEIAKALPNNLTPDRVVRIVLTELRNNPKLQACRPLSILAAVMQASQLGLEIGNALGHAYLIPYKDEARLQIGYKGHIALIRRSGEIKTLYAKEVYEGDTFEYEYGTDPHIKHIPSNTDGHITHVYAVCILTNGGIEFDVMTIGEVERHRDRFTKATRTTDPWATDFAEMAKKTVLLRLGKRLPKCTEAADAINYETKIFEEQKSDFERFKAIHAAPDIRSEADSEVVRKRLSHLLTEAENVQIDVTDLKIAEIKDEAKLIAVCTVIENRIAEATGSSYEE
jgi:recombination protein RecT